VPDRPAKKKKRVPNITDLPADWEPGDSGFVLNDESRLPDFILERRRQDEEAEKARKPR